MPEVRFGSEEHRRAIDVGLACAGANCTVAFTEAHGTKVLCGRCFEEAKTRRRLGLHPRAWFEELED